MGTLAHFNLQAIAEMHGVRNFVETGTAQGDSLALAATIPEFAALHSVEIMPDLVSKAKMRFASDARVQIWEGDSRSCLPMILRELSPEPTLFWLDAHFPGAHTAAQTVESYAAEQEVGKRLPLEDEINLIRAARGEARDILLIDDARIYLPLDLPGALPKDWPPLAGIKRSLDFVRDAYGTTHGVVVDFADQWYGMVFPRKV